MKTLEGIEQAVRGHLLKHGRPELGHFLSAKAAVHSEAQRRVTSIIGRLSLSEQPGRRLGLKARSQWSPHLERCCLLLSTHKFYASAAQDINEKSLIFATVPSLTLGSGGTALHLSRQPTLSEARTHVFNTAIALWTTDTPPSSATRHPQTP